MKPASGTFISNLANYSNWWIAQLYTFTLLDGTILTYTDFESDVTLSGTDRFAGVPVSASASGPTTATSDGGGGIVQSK